MKFNFPKFSYSIKAIGKITPLATRVHTQTTADTTRQKVWVACNVLGSATVDNRADDSQTHKQHDMNKHHLRLRRATVIVHNGINLARVNQ